MRVIDGSQDCRRPPAWAPVLAALILAACSPAPLPVAELSEDARWLDAVSAGIQRASFQPRFTPSGAHVRNSVQGIGADFDSSGVTLRPLDPAADWSGSLRLSAWGREGAEASAGPADVTPAPCADRTLDVEGRCVRGVSLGRPGLDEWWHNRSEGLEQGWTIAAEPPGTGALSLVLDTDGLVPSLDGAGSIRLRPAGTTQSLRYAGLHSVDAHGTTLPSALALDGSQIRITVDVDGAVWPVTVDPLITNVAWGWSSGVYGAAAGKEVAGLGDVNGDGYGDIAVAAPTYNFGTVWVFYGSSAGPGFWADWTASGSSAFYYFGQAVDAAGDVNGDGFGDVIIGAPDCVSVNCNGGGAGSAFVYHGSASGLGATADWVVLGDGSDARFGQAVAGAGDVNGDGFGDVVVGSPGKSSNKGRIYVFHGASGGLAVTETTSAAGLNNGDELGARVVGVGDLDADGYSDIVASAPGATFGSGTVQAHYGSATGASATRAWVITQGYLGGFGLGLGDAGDVDGDGYADFLVGAPNATGGAGRGYLYYGGAGQTAPALGLSVNGSGNDALGFDLSGLGDVNGDGFADLAIGAPYADSPDDGGDVLVYHGSAAGPVLFTTLSTSQQNAHFGYSVAAAGDVDGDGFADLLVGLDGWDGNFVEGEGSAELFIGSPAGLTDTADWTSFGNNSGAAQGFAVAGAGDVNADGFDDVLVGAPYFDNGQTDEGRVWFFPGAAAGLATTATWTTEPNLAGARLGAAVAGAGDVNADGYADILLGAPGWDANRGIISLHLGGASGPVTAPVWTVVGEPASQLGTSVAAAGDVNGDGYDDLLAGSPEWSNGQTEEGGALLALGAPGGPASIASWLVEGNQSFAAMGCRVAGLGDVDGDGFDDFAVSACNHDNTLVNEGRVAIWYGSPKLPAVAADLNLYGAQAGAALGQGLSGAGDVNGDGYDDLLVGAPGWDTGQFNGAGRVTLHLGSAARLSSTPDSTWEGLTAEALGSATASAGDVNGDGYGDIAMGAPTGTSGVAGGSNPPGVARVFFGGASGPGTGADWTYGGGQGGAELGAALSGAGDVNGDGFDDLLVGAPGFDDGQSDEGRVSLFSGGGGDGVGWGASPRPRADDGAGTLHPPGAHVGSTFTVRADGRPIRGAGDVRIEVEAKLLGVAFDGTGTVLSALAFSGTAGVDVAASIAIADEAAMHWRARLVADPTEGHEVRTGRWMWGGRGGSALGRHVVGPCVADLDGDGACDSFDFDADGDGDPGTTDCDDFDATVYNGAPELCDGIDNDCDGALDEDFDSDGDGFYDDNAAFGCATPWPGALDCDDTDPTVNPDAAEVCNGVDDDCNGAVDDVSGGLPSWYIDADADGYGSPNVVLLSCTQPTGTSANALDCDDTDPAVNPAAVEICDGLDTNCDGTIPPSESDDDGDTYNECAGLDCNDADASVNPGASELCDGLDTNCDGTVPSDELDADGDGFRVCAGDCDDNRASVNPSATEACDGWDTDCDASTTLPTESDGDGDGFYPCTYVTSGGNPALAGDDCDDADPAINPGAVEVCDGGVDNDCDPATVEGSDTDGDGFDTCTDCNDTDAAVFPGAVEICDGKDSDCDGSVPADEADGDQDAFVACTFDGGASPPSGLGDDDCDDAAAAIYPGATEQCDGLDGDCDGAVPSNEADGDADGFAICDGDCDDADATRYPGATELCDGLDNDCNGTLPANEQDQDGDTVLACAGDCNDGNAAVYPGATEQCDGLDGDCDGTVPADEIDSDSDGWRPCGGDCDDTDAGVSPGATEACDAVDTNCDGTIPPSEVDGDGDGDLPCTGDCDDADPATYTGAIEACDAADNDCDGSVDEDFDQDGDGAFDATDPGCTATYGAAADCDDTLPSVGPGQPETCNAIDDDCDGSVDEDFDQDADGYFDLTACAEIGGADCDDGDASTYPGAAETCDGGDNDCDGSVDEDFDQDGDGAFDASAPGCLGQYGLQADCDDADPAVLPGATEVCDGLDQDCDGLVPGDETDGDGDGWVECASPTANHVGSPTGGGDCDDTAGNVFPGAPELCNAVDDDCDGSLDEDFDADGDGAFDGSVPFCVASWGAAVDCDDGDPAVFPGATELCNGVDDDCDAGIDEGFDADGDGVTTCGGDCDDTDPAINPNVTEDCTTAYDDNCDGVTTATDADGDGVDTCSGDCDDGDANVFPGATEVCDGADQNCDGVIDDGFDADGDGVTSCGGDCDDGDAGIAPGTPELCDALDQDCDGAVDEAFDLDGDGYYDGANADCVAAWTDTDCNDSNPLISPVAAELCNLADEDCDGAIDEDFDADGDGAFDASNAGCAANYGALADCDDTDPLTYGGAEEICDGLDNDCEGSVPPSETDDDGDGVADCDGDCDDTSAAVFPGAPELCNGADDDCDGDADEDFDVDGDGYADGEDPACAGLLGADCDDTSVAVFPGAPELCNAIDDNCDGVLDEDFDLDGDGWVDGLDPDCVTAWGAAVDCDDADPDVFPGNFEDCINGVDDNCNGLVDEDLDDDADGVTTCGGDCNDADPTINLFAAEVCNGIDEDCDFSADEDFDADGDGAYDGADPGCDATYGLDADCDDADATINPSAAEVCDGVDQDCDGVADQPFDLDGDLHFELTACQGALGGLELDCDDADPTVYVGADELCDDGKDNDCDFLVDGEDPTCAGDDDDSTGDDDDSGDDDDDDSTGDDDDSGDDDDDDDDSTASDDDDSAPVWYYPGCQCGPADAGGPPWALAMLLPALSRRTRRRVRPAPRDPTDRPAP